MVTMDTIKVKSVNGLLKRLSNQSLFIYKQMFIYSRPGGQIVKKLTFDLGVDFKVEVWYPNIEREVLEMANKKKTQTVGVIKGIDILKSTRPMQDIPFRTYVAKDKKKEEKRKREKINKNRLDKWL